MKLFRYVGCFWEAFKPVWGLLVLVAVFLAASIVVMVYCVDGLDTDKAWRQGLSWFFGNGSQADTMPWLQLVGCMLCATLGYVFLGILLAVVVEGIKVALKRS
jgi:hypothetical protein